MKRFRSLFTIMVMTCASMPLLNAAKNNQAGVIWEYIGQVTNTGPQSAQYGNLTNVSGLPAGTYLTFYTAATNTSVVVDGPLRIIDRTGTTTIYLASGVGDFSNPETFRSGIPVQISNLKQQVIVNTLTGSFSVLNTNSITAVSPINNSDDSELLREAGQSIRSTLNGQLNTAGTPSPTGWFSGYASR